MTPRMRFHPRRLLVTALLTMVVVATARAQGDLPETGRAPAPDSAAIRQARRVEMGQRLMEADSLVRAQGGSRGDMARLYLTWDAPYGHPRARANRTARCTADTTRGDTLYLSCLPGRASRGLNAFTADLRVHAAVGDSVGDWWRMERGGPNAGSVVVEFGPDASFPGRQPWRVAGRGAALLQHRVGETQLKLIHAVALDDAAPVVADSVYTLARVIFRHRRVLPGCEQPACIEWATGSLAYGLKDEPEILLGERVVAWNSPDGSVCAPYRARGVTRAWKPGTR